MLADDSLWTHVGRVGRQPHDGSRKNWVATADVARWLEYIITGDAEDPVIGRFGRARPETPVSVTTEAPKQIGQLNGQLATLNAGVAGSIIAPEPLIDDALRLI